MRIQTFYLMLPNLKEDGEITSPSDLTLMNFSDEIVENKEDEPLDWNSLKSIRG